MTGSAIPIPTENGTLFVLHPEQGFTVGARYCEVITKYFGVSNGDDTWQEEWRRVTASSMQAELKGDIFPDVIFIPNGLHVQSAVRVNSGALSNYGIDDLRIIVRVDADAKIVTPEIVDDVTNTPTSKLKGSAVPGEFSTRLKFKRAIT